MSRAGKSFRVANVFFGNEQTVSRKNRTMVQKSQGEFVFKHPIARHFSANDVAKRAIGRDASVMNQEYGARNAVPDKVLGCSRIWWPATERSLAVAARFSVFTNR